MPKYTKTNVKIYETKNLKIKSNSIAEKWYTINGEVVIRNLEILGQSDNLEDLIDDFVVIDKNYRRTIFPDSGKETLKRILETYNPNEYSIFVGIWTSYGLKFIGRVNCKGEIMLYKR